MPLKMRTGRSSLGRDQHGNPLDRVVREALEVPPWVERLRVAGAVGGARGEHVFAGCGVPVEAPAAPGVRAERGLQNRSIEGDPAVGRDLYSFDAAVAGPGAAAEGHRSGFQVTDAGHEVRHAG